MDPELKVYLDAFRREVAQQIGATNQKMDTVNAETRQELTGLMEQGNAETRQELTARMEQLNAETRQELTVRMEQLNVEARRELRALMEDVRREIRLVADGVITVRDQLGRILTDHEARITALEQRHSS